MIKILNDTAQKSLGIVKNSSLVKSWWKNQLTKVYKEYKDTRKAFTYRAIPASHKKLKSTKELTDNAKKHEKAFNFDYFTTAQDGRQFWKMLEKVTGKKTNDNVEPLINESNSYTFNDKEISDIFKKTFWHKTKQL